MITLRTKLIFEISSSHSVFATAHQLFAQTKKPGPGTRQPWMRFDIDILNSARMKLHKQRTAACDEPFGSELAAEGLPSTCSGPELVERQAESNVEGWYRFRLRLRLRPDRSLSLFYKIDRIPYFYIRYSFFKVSFSIRPAVFFGRRLG